jgi:hypothetical protein
VTDIQEDIGSLLHAQLNREDEETLQWLTNLEYAPQHNDYFKRRQPGTGQWFLTSANFQRFQDNDKETLFCPGIPGSGKTTLTSIVIDHLERRHLNNNKIGIAYIYCNFRRHEEEEADNLLACILKQLARRQPSLPKNVKDLFQHHRRRATRPSMGDISRALLTVAALYTKVFVVVDALDECRVSNNDRSRLLSELFSLQAATNTNIFATSRPNHHIEEEFRGCPSQKILASDEDVHRYLDGYMTHMPAFVLKRLNLQGEIRENISKAADGMYVASFLVACSK